MADAIIRERLLAKIVVGSEQDCWPWTGAQNGRGYGSFNLYGRTVGAHRAVYLTEVGDIPDGLEVRHTCDNRLCCNPGHMKLGTHQQNMVDMRDRVRGRIQRLSLEDAKAIRQAYFVDGVKQGDLADRYGVTLGAINNVVLGKVFKELGRPSSDEIKAANRRCRFRPRGFLSHRSKLTEEQVRAIRSEYSTGKYTQKQLAMKYGVSQMPISRLLTGKTYANVS